MTLPKSTTISMITFAVLIVLPSTIYLHNSYADGRYVQKVDATRDKIEQIDDSLFEIEQEVSFETDEQKKRKWVARREYYKNKKARLVEALKQKK